MASLLPSAHILMLILTTQKPKCCMKVPGLHAAVVERHTWLRVLLFQALHDTRSCKSPLVSCSMATLTSGKLGKTDLKLPIHSA